MTEESRDNVFLKACRKEPVPYTPIWLMRQAGRYMKSYRDLRAQVSFLDLCKRPDLAAEMTVMAAHLINADAAIIFADILLITEPMGFNLEYTKGQGPVIHNPFRKASDLSRLQPAETAQSLSFVYEAISQTREHLSSRIGLIGFAGAPFTVAAYLLEGKSPTPFTHTKNLMREDPQTWHALLKHITNATLEYLNAQIDAGCDAIQLFDTWVGTLNEEEYRAFVMPHTQHLFENLRQTNTPLIYFGTKNAHLLNVMRETRIDVMGVDHRVDLDKAWNMLGDMAIQGNLNPSTLLEAPSVIEKQAQRILDQAKNRPGHIFNLGHGVLPSTPVEHVQRLVDFVHEKSQR